MAHARGMTDRLGLPPRTRSAVAAEQHLIGVDRFLSLNAGADEGFRLAIEAGRHVRVARSAGNEAGGNEGLQKFRRV